MKKEIFKKAKKIKVIGMDIDGVLTKGELIILNSGEEVKIWNIKDRFAYFLVRKFLPGIKLAWITGRESKEVEIRGKELKIEFLYQKCSDKLEYFNKILESGYKDEEIAYIGDDWMDIPILKRAGLSISPKDAPNEVKKFVHYISKYDGGCGVFREVVEIILKSRGIYKKVFNLYSK